ncbi:Hypothetical predicted protein, partial [Marmota monax]
DTQQLPPCRKSSHRLHTGTLAATLMWTPIYQCGARPVAAILGLCISGDSPLHIVPLPVPGNFTQPLKSANSLTLRATRLISEFIIRCHCSAPLHMTQHLTTESRNFYLGSPSSPSSVGGNS